MRTKHGIVGLVSTVALLLAVVFITRAQVALERPTFINSNTVRLVVSGPTTNIRYDVYFTNALSSNAAAWPLLVTGGTNQVIFDITVPDTNAGFFIVTSNYLASSNPPPQVATPVFSPASASGNAAVTVTVTCDTPGAVTYYSTNGSTPTTSDTYIPTGGKLTISCATTLKARAFRSGFLDSDVATGTYNVNCPPFVFAGNQQVTSGSSVTLQGVATDDGLASPLSNYWRQASGPTSVTFGNSNATNSTVTLPQDGIYVLQLEAFDGYWTSTSRVTVARNPKISITITTPSSGSTFTVPTNFTLSASTTGSSVTITQVQFFTGSTLIGTASRTDTNQPFSMDWRNVPAGSHTVSAVATSDNTTNFSLASSPVSITVNFPTDIGRFTVAETDLQIPVAGFPIAVNRSHDTRYGASYSFGRNGRLDYEQFKIRADSMSAGWQGSHPLQWCVSESAAHLVTVTLAEGDDYYFRPRVVFTSTGSGCINAANPHGYNEVYVRLAFDAIGGRGGALTNTAPSTLGLTPVGYDAGDGCLGAWEGPLKLATFESDGLEICGAIATDWEPSLADFTFTASDGTRYKFDSTGKLRERIDQNNNSLTFGTTGITNSNGKRIQFTRDGSGRITNIYDPIAITSSGLPVLKYKYDGNGSLTNVARLVNRSGSGTYEETGYLYQDAAYPYSITRVIDARSITVISNLYDASGRLFRRFDALGNYTTYSYEDNGRRQVVTDKNGKSTSTEFTDAGLIANVQNGENAVTSYSYDAQGRRISELTPIGGTNTFAYNDRDDLVGVTNELNFNSSATYSSIGQPIVVIDAMGFGTTNGYDSKGNLAAVTNALSQVSRYGYDSQGNRKAETNAFGLSEQVVTQFDYDQYGYLTNVSDALGNKTAYTYDDNGNRLTERRERTLASGSKQTLWLTNVYDAANRIVAVIEPDGFANRTAFNVINKVAYTTNKLGVVTRFDYDARGLLTNTVFALGTAHEVSEQSYFDAEERRTNSVDRAGRSTTFTYDGVGRLRRTTFPDSTYTDNQYDVGGRLYATVEGPRPPGGAVLPQSGVTTRYEYDAAGRRTAVVNALSQTNFYGYDNNGNQITFVDALNRTNRYEFDRLNRQIKLTLPDNTFESYGYDALGRRFAVTNQASVVARFGYDPLGRLTGVTNAWGTGTSNWVTYAYDEVGNQTNQVDALNRRTRFEYDAMGRRSRSIQPGGQFEGFTYDAVGNQIRYTNFNLVIITNQFDALNRITNKSSAGGYNVAITYTVTGQRKAVTDPSGSYTFAYDTRDRLATNSGPAGTLVYTYDDFGRLKSTASTRATGVSTTYAYDVLNRLSNVVDVAAGTTTYGFDAVGNLQTVRYPNTLTNSYQYDSLNRLTNLTAKNSSGQQANFFYKLAAAGNRTNLSENIGGTTRTLAWAYDSLYRLTNEVLAGTSPAGTNAYRYDAVGNRTNRTVVGTGLTNQSFTFNTNDWLSTDVYDSNGSTRTNGANAFFYDVENRLTNATVNGTTVSYTYNVDGNRVSKTIGSTNTLYLVDDRNPTGYAQVVEELTVTGGTTNLAKVFTHGLDLIAQRQVSGNLVTFYGYDGNGNTRYLTATNAAISDTYFYDAFGSLLTSTGTNANDYLYTGEQYDPTLALYYLRARYLNTGTGRFWTRDTFAGRNEDPLSLHRYLYAGANPVNNIDPSGKETLVGLITSIGSRLLVAANYTLRVGQAYVRVKSAVDTVDALREAYDILATVLTEGVDGLDEEQTGEIQSAVIDGLENLAKRIARNIILKRVPRIPVLGVVAGGGGGGGGGTPAAGQFLNDTWHKGTFPNKFQSVTYHLSKHGKGRTAQQYSQDAMNTFNANKHLGQKIILKDGTPGIKIQIKQIDPVTGKTTKIGGYWTDAGKLVTFWD